MALLFDTVLNIGSPGTPFTTNNTEIGGTFGARTLVYLFLSSGLTFIGFNPTGGPIDKATVAVIHASNNGSASSSFAHESLSTTAARNRLWNPGLSSINTGTGIGGVEYVYNAALQRWICLSRTQ